MAVTGCVRVYVCLGDRDAGSRRRLCPGVCGGGGDRDTGGHRRLCPGVSGAHIPCGADDLHWPVERELMVSLRPELMRDKVSVLQWRQLGPYELL